MGDIKIKQAKWTVEVNKANGKKNHHPEFKKTLAALIIYGGYRLKI